jgi:ADP-dependent NAD(P)H-hydrate dehydratase
MSEPTPVDEELLDGWPLPEPGSSKDARGTVLMVGGSTSVPGGMVLAGEAALRAGAGKLQVATTRGVAEPMAVTLPEARVERTEEVDSGDIAPSAAGMVVELAASAEAVLLGPGITRPDRATELLREIVPRLKAQAVVIDALGSAYVTEDADCVRHLDRPAVLTVNPDELAHALHVDQDRVAEDPARAALDLAHRTSAVVLCGGSDKYVASPDGRCWKVSRGNPGLGVSGSGDVQAGIVTGLLARGATPEQAAVWGGWLHGRSGEVLAERIGPVGYLARELPAVVPGLLAERRGSQADR